MHTDSIALFEKHKPIYDFFINHGVLVNFHQHIQQQLLEVYNLEAGDNYDYDENCYICVTDFIHLIYKWYGKAKRN